MKIISEKEIKKRWLLLALGILLFSILSYKFALHNTIKLINNYTEQRVVQSDVNINNFSVSTKEAEKISEYLSKYKTDTMFIHKNLLDSVNTMCNKYNCKISSFPNSYTSTEFNYLLLNNTIELEGNYFSLLKIIHKIENSGFYGKINACKFYVLDDLRTKKKSIRLQLYLQHLTSI
jgi:hypothetical protein